MNKKFGTLIFIILSILGSAIAHAAPTNRLKLDCTFLNRKKVEVAKATFELAENGPLMAFTPDNRNLVFLGLDNAMSDQTILWMGREGADGIALSKIDAIELSQINEGEEFTLKIKWFLGIKRVYANCKALEKSFR